MTEGQGAFGGGGRGFKVEIWAESSNKKETSNFFWKSILLSAMEAMATFILILKIIYKEMVLKLCIFIIRVDVKSLPSPKLEE